MNQVQTQYKEETSIRFGGDDDHVWIVGEGSLTLKAQLISDSDGLSLSQWQQSSIDTDRPELLFTVAGSTFNSSPVYPSPWLVGGLAEGKAWRWSADSFAPGNGKPLVYHQPPL